MSQETGRRKDKRVKVGEQEQLPQAVGASKENRQRAPLQLQEAIARYEETVSSRERLAAVYDRFVRRRYEETDKMEVHEEERGRVLYEKMANSEASPGEETEWHNTIAYGSASKLSAVVNHLLGSGPLTESELSILEKAIALLKEYYVSAARARVRRTGSASDSIKMFIPPQDTYSYKIFIDEDDKPIESFVGANKS